MFKLKFNKEKLTEQELHQIEKRFKSYLREKITPDFNVLNLNRTDVYAHVLSIFTRLHIHQNLDIDASQMLDFIIDVAEEYSTQASYHTFYHAADIVTVLYYLCNDLNADKYLTDLDITFLMVAALCHDTGHPGFNNTFQTSLKTELVEKYGEKSVLETYSVDLTIQLLEKHDIRHAYMNDTIRDLILSTDMAYHNDLEQKAKQLFTTWDTKKLSKDDRLSLSSILLHAADISNMARPWMISKQWSDLIIQEFFKQGDEEKKRNMTISPGMDREMNTQQNISLKFGEVILSFLRSLVTLLPKSHVFVDFLASNRIQWECLEEKQTKKRQLRRVSSDIPPIVVPSIITSTTTTTTTTTITTTTTKYKRIKLGCRSQSYPTVLYTTQNNCNNNHQHLDKSHDSSSFLLTPPSLVTFRSASFYEKPNNNIIETIVLYHPYDQ